MKLRKTKIRNPNKIIIWNFNINSFRNRFEQLKDIVIQHIDILILTETKLDNNFPTAQLLVNGFSEPYRLDRNRKGWGVIVYIREDIPSSVNMFFYMIWKVYLLNSILRYVNGYFLEHTTHLPKQIFIILVISIKHLTLTVVIKMFTYRSFLHGNIWASYRFFHLWTWLT